MGLIYKHTFKTTGKSYIGLTVKSMKSRLSEHIKESLKGSETHFHRALRKYGELDLISEILEDDIPKSELSGREIFFIEVHGTFTDGYNLTKGGHGALGLSFSDSRKREMSERMRGMVVVSDSITNETKLVNVKEWEKNPNLEAVSKGQKRAKTLCNWCEKMVYPSEKMYHFDYCESNPTRASREIECEYCSKIFKDSTGLGNHKIYCKQNPKRNTVPHNCKYCEKEYPDPRNRNQHEKTCIKNKNREHFFCEFCKRELKNKSGLSTHLKTCRKNPNSRVIIHQCKFCSREFVNNKMNLIKHERFCEKNPQKEKKEVFECICGKIYSDIGNFTKHINKCKRSGHE